MEQEKRKDLWDKIAALTPLILGLFITGVGAVFTHVYNFRQLQLNQLTALEKLRPQLTSDNPEEREFAYSSFVALGYEDTAIRIIQIKKDQSGRPVLEQLQHTGSPQIRENAGAALKVLDEAQKLVNIFEFRDPHGLEPYYESSKKIANDLGVTTQLGQAVIYDTLVQSGARLVYRLSAITTEIIGSEPKDGADEKTWIKEFLRQRNEHFKGRGQEFLVKRRIAELQKLIEQNDWELQTIKEN